MRAGAQMSLLGSPHLESERIEEDNPRKKNSKWLTIMGSVNGIRFLNGWQSWAQSSWETDEKKMLYVKRKRYT